MGIYDRDYARDGTRSGWGGGGGVGRMMRRRGPWTVNTWLIVSNVLVHVVAMTVFAVRLPTGRNWSKLHEYGHWSTARGFFEIVPSIDPQTGQAVSVVNLHLEVWRLLSFQFLHSPDTIWHLFFNMFGLFIFGPMVEETLGRRKYLAFYLVCGIMGGVMYVFLNLLGMAGIPLPGVLETPPNTPLVGASAGVFGVIMACAHIAPNTVIQLIFPPIPVKMKWLAYGYVGLSLFNLLTSGQNAGGDAAHVGGAIAGYFFIRNSHHLGDFFDVLGNSKQPARAPSRGSAKAGGRKKAGRGPSDAEVDRILEKVHLKGIQSLTKREKRLLEKARDR